MAKNKHHARRRTVQPHHHKPYRRRHIASLLLLLAVCLVLAVEIGVVIGHNQHAVAPAVHQASSESLQLTRVHSAAGYSFEVNSTNFTVTSSDHGATVRAKPGSLDGPVAATVFTVEINPDTAALTAIRQKPENAGLSAQQAAAKLFPVNVSSGLDVKILTETATTLNAVPAYKITYEFTNQHGGGKSYAVAWYGASNDRAFMVKLSGLVGSPNVPVAFAPILTSLNISADQAVLGASTSIFSSPAADAARKLDAKYLSDAVSPAVVQIFHTVCGVLTIDGERIGDSGCISVTGSGFLATASGYIATNGHVVEYSAKDAVANLITSNDSVRQAYLQSLGLSASEMAAAETDPPTLASLIAKIYDYPDSQLKFSDTRELTLVALGNQQPNLQRLADLKSSAQLARFHYDSDTIKPAEVIGSDYSSKDSYTTISDPQSGFSSSDVALLKIAVRQAPVIPIATTKVVQNQKIIVMGFPGDAGNPLVDNRQNDVTVTDGVISSIRQAAGGTGRLYQSDADASHGNSGGPAIDDQGQVIGLLTYRYDNPEPGDAAKSYIRDIADFAALARSYDVQLDSRSQTQDHWLKGLDLYSHNHFSAALKDFAAVQTAYPAHRLVADYISSSKEAIAKGEDVKDLPVDLLAVLLLAALLGMGAMIVVIARHHGLHLVYQLSQTQPAPPAPPPPAPPKSRRLVQ